MIKKLMARVGYIHHTDVTATLANLREACGASLREQKRLRLMAGKLTDQHLAMHRQMVDAEKALAHSEEEVKHLKSILAEERHKSMSLVTQPVTQRSLPVTRTVVKSRKRKA